MSDWKEAARQELKTLQGEREEASSHDQQRPCEVEFDTATVGSEAAVAQSENILESIIRKNERLDRDVEKACKETDTLRQMLEERDEGTRERRRTREEELEMQVQELKDELDLERSRSWTFAQNNNRLREQLETERSENAHRRPGLTFNRDHVWDEGNEESLSKYSSSWV